MLIFADDTKLMNRGVKAEKILLEAGFRFISSSWMMQRHKSSSCFWEAKSLRAHRLLGFWHDYRLDWNCHVAQVCKKLLRGIHLLRKLVWAITSDHLLKIYHALLHSHVAYMECSFRGMLQPVRTFCSIRKGHLGFLPQPTDLNIKTSFQKTLNFHCFQLVHFKFT